MSQAERSKRYREKHPERIAAAAKKYRDANREKVRKWKRDDYARNKLRQRNSYLRWSFGITLEQYNEMFKLQGGTCAICFRPCGTGRTLAVDHNHTTGQVRDLLCGLCNKGLGQFVDDPALLRQAADYLERHSHKFPAITEPR